MNQVIPAKYVLKITPDFSDFSFSASLNIHATAVQPVSRISLNMLELAVWQCSILKDGRFIPCSYTADPKKERLDIGLEGETSGEITIKIDYEGKINDKMAGFYRSRYVENGEDKHIAVTQFQESDARRAMPCMDHPLYKASFEIEMIVDQGLKAISNEVALEEIKGRHGKRHVKFRRTPKMSSYLVFMGVGDFESIRDEKDPRVCVVTLPGSTRYGVYGAAFGRNALKYCENYFRIAYPLPKMDLIAVPDFAFGAMENWGAITFRENLLLYYPDRTSKAGEQRICEVIAHEIVHQWFGNLVTPSDWKYLWLNESFATYFAYRIVDFYHPDWDTWSQFLIGQTDSAMIRDQLTNTQAIEIPGGEHVVINSSTAPIIYSKGGSILRQVEGYIGNDAFQNGLHHYLTTHAYGNAASEDLWKSFEEVSYKPVTAMMKNWIEQPGYPVISVEKIDDILVLRQKRFTCLDGDYDQTWLIPVSVRVFTPDGKSRRLEILMDSDKAYIDAGKDVVAYKVNEGQTGYYRVRYLKVSDMQDLGESIKQKQLSPEDRWGVQNDLFAFVKSSDTTFSEYLKFLKWYDQENSFLPLSSIASNLFHGYLVFKDSKRQEIKAFGNAFLGRVLSEAGLRPEAGEPVTISMLRDQILWHAALYGNSTAENFAMEQFESLKKENDIHPDIMKAVLQVAAMHKGAEALEWMKHRFRTSESEHDRMNVLAAIACFKEPDLIDQALTFTLEEVPSRNKFISIAATGANVFAQSMLWDWFVKNISELEKMHPLHFERVITGIIPVAGMEKASEVKAFMNRYMEKEKRAKDAIELALEKMEINLRML